MRHRLIISLLVIVSLITFHLPMKGEAADSLYRVFLSCPAGSKAATADDLFKQLHSLQACDTLLHYNKLGKPDQADARLHYMMAEYYYNTGQFESSLEASRRAEGLFDKINDLSFKSDVMSTIANAQFRMDDYDDALVSVLAAYRIDLKLNDKELISSDLNTLAAIYLAVQQPRPGIDFIEKAIALERKLGHRDHLAIRLGLASELYLLNGETEKALHTIQEAYDIDTEDGRDVKAAIRQAQKAAVLEKSDQLDEARALLEKALVVLEPTQKTYSVAVCHNQLGSILQKQGHTTDAINHYKKALELSIQCSSPKLERNAERGLWETMREDNPSIAMIHLERYATLSDSLRNRITSLQMKVLDTTLQDIEQTEVKDAARHKRQFLFWAGSLLALMLLITAIGLFRTWHRSKKALQQEQQSQELRSHFLSNITRALHTPLTVILGAGQQLCESSRVNPEENERIGKMIVGQGNNMLGMLNKLLDIEMVKAAVEEPDWKDGDIVLFTRLMVNNFADEARQHDIRLDFTSPVKSLMVKFIPEYVGKIIKTLVTNSIIYTPRNGNISVNLTPLENDKISLIIADTGKGIPPDEISRIFDPFTQGENGDDGVGTSLSLSLVNHMVKTMGGEIIVDTEPGKGTAFTIIVPVQQSSNSFVEQQETAAQFARQPFDTEEDKSLKPLVFIVENDDDIAYLMANHLRDDYNLRFLRDGQDAYDQIQTLMPDLIVTSINISTIDGKELMQKVRSNQELKHIPIIAVTSVRSVHERVTCLEVGANAVLVKPFSTQELRLEAKHLIEYRSILHERFLRNNETAPDSATSVQSKEDQQFLSKFVDTIYAQMAKQETNMDHVAAAMSVSRNQLRSRIMALTGMSPMTYALQLRLNYACRLILSDEGTPLTLIANKCGFQSLAHFSNSFKQQFGMSPKQYRKSHNDLSHPN
ncbi:MAG: helix-turn-helix domain-containing protein [Muribaculaceae bacterium]|nr:helix-turn-helix domain-containing protein [Muribaculaceae bacterium]